MKQKVEHILYYVITVLQVVMRQNSPINLYGVSGLLVDVLTSGIGGFPTEGKDGKVFALFSAFFISTSVLAIICPIASSMRLVVFRNSA